MLSRIMLVCLSVLVVGLPGMAENWPAWRGPQHNGVTEDSAPLEWTTEKNVRWRTPLPEAGNSSPVVWDKYVFVTQPVEDSKSRTLVCLDRESGDILWQKGVEYDADESTHRTNPYCSPSPVTDGERVIVWFGSAGLVCFDMQGEELWKRDLGAQSHMWGYGSSPILHENLCILNFGPGEREFLIAVDKQSGETVWQVDQLPIEEEQKLSGPENEGEVDRSRYDAETTLATRLRGSWSTPMIIESEGRSQLLVTQPRRLSSYDPASGKLLWFCGDYAPLAYSSPLYGDGIAIALGGYFGASLAVSVDGAGDVTEDALWHKSRDSNWLSTGITHAGHLYSVDMNGVLHCLNIKTGEETWKYRLRSTSGREATWGSMIMAGGLLYILNQSGDTFVFRPSPEKYDQVARNSIDEQTNSTLVVSDGQLFLRTHEALWCISE